MFLYAFVLFALAAAGGFVMAMHINRDHFAPWPAAIVHGLLALSGVVALLYITINGPEFPAQLHFAVIALVVLLITFATGVFFFFVHFFKNKPSKAMIFVHALLGLIGIALLLLAIL